MYITRAAAYPAPNRIQGACSLQKPDPRILGF